MYRLVVTVAVRSPVLELFRRLVVPLALLVETRLALLSVPLLETVPLDLEEVLLDVLGVELRRVMEVVDWAQVEFPKSNARIVSGGCRRTNGYSSVNSSSEESAGS